MVQAVANASPPTALPDTSDPLAAIRSYATQHRASLIDVTATMDRFTRSDFERADGFLWKRKDGTEILVPAERFRAEFADHENMMRALRASGDATTETGQNPKLTIKTPKAICDQGRVYCILMERNIA